MNNYQCYCDYDPPKVYSTQMRISRKSHKCTECRRAITIGERYEYFTGMWNNRFSVFRTCPHCLCIRDWARISFPCYDQCWAYGGVLDEVREYVHEEAYKVPGLFFEYGRRVIKARRYRKGLTA